MQLKNVISFFAALPDNMLQKQSRKGLRTNLHVDVSTEVTNYVFRLHWTKS